MSSITSKPMKIKAEDPGIHMMSNQQTEGTMATGQALEMPTPIFV